MQKLLCVVCYMHLVLNLWHWLIVLGSSLNLCVNIQGTLSQVTLAIQIHYNFSYFLQLGHIILAISLKVMKSLLIHPYKCVSLFIHI